MRMERNTTASGWEDNNNEQKTRTCLILCSILLLLGAFGLCLLWVKASGTSVIQAFGFDSELMPSQ